MKNKFSQCQSSEGNEDFISDLPKDVMDSILMRLPIRDVVRTTILSTKWRYKWITVPVITFDTDCVLKDKTIFKLISAVDQTLLHHVGPIRSFSCDLYMKPSSHVDRWIVYLSRNGLRKLVLVFPEMESYEMPSSLFNCEELCYLKLALCTLEVPQKFCGFSCLTTLHFEDVEISQEGLEFLLSNCPHLERLTMKYFEYDWLCICVPNLHSVILKGSFKQISFEGSSKLANLYIDYNDEDSLSEYEEELSFQYEGDFELCTLTSVLGCLSEIECFKAKRHLMRFLCLGCLPDRLPITFHRLSELSLDVNLTNSRHVLAILCLCRSAPNLQILKIKCDEFEDDTETWRLAGERINCSFNSLKVVKILGTSGKMFDLKFMKYVLAKSPVLESLMIKVSRKEEEVRILKELVRFRRASAKAEIVYLD